MLICQIFHDNELQPMSLQRATARTFRMYSKPRSWRYVGKRSAVVADGTQERFLQEMRGFVLRDISSHFSQGTK